MVTIPKAAAIVVTYNRLALLQECIEALAQQTLPLGKIYIIDNASTDGTQEWFAASKYGSSEQFELVELGKNAGGAGGFEAGMKLAMGHDFDWLWLMDDDSIAQPDALKQLIDSSAADDANVGVLATKVVGSDGQLLEMNNQMLFDSWTGDVHKVSLDQFEQPAFSVDGSSFVGFMVRAEAVRRVGLPYGKFFIHFDDHEYSLRLRQAGYVITVITKAVIMHKLTLMRQDDAPKNKILASELWKYYYSQRNEIWGLPHYIHPWYRVIEFRARRLWWVIKRCLNYLKLDHTWLRMKIEWQAYIDGTLGRLGKRIDPAAFKQQLIK